jgi:O-antigen/teichoic acid export membrane protein
MSRTLSNIIYAFAGVLVGQILGSFNSFFLAKILSPSNYGIWMTLIMIGSFSPILCFGTAETLLKEYPFYIGRREIDKAKRLESGVIGSIVIASSFVFFLAVIFPAIIPGHMIGGLGEYIRIMLLSAGIGLFSAFLYHRFAAHQIFKIVAFLDSFRSMLIFIFLVSFSWYWGIEGTVIGFFLVESIVCLVSFILSVRYCGKLNIYLNLSYLASLVKTGFPISIVWWAYIIQVSVDRGMSMLFLGKEPTGFYSLGMSITSLFLLFPQVIGRVLYPKVNESIGKGAGKTEIDLIVMVPSRALSLFTPVASMVFIIFLPILYKNIFTKYYPGLLSAQVLMVGISFMCIIRGGINYLVSTNRQNKIIYYMFIAIFINVVLNYILINNGLNIFGIGLSTVISGLVLSALIWYGVFNGMMYSKMNAFIEVLKLFMPIIVMISIALPIIGLAPQWMLYSYAVVVLLSFLSIMLYGIILYNIPYLNCWIMEIILLFKNKIMAT